jgi:hypothetical protein
MSCFVVRTLRRTELRYYEATPWGRVLVQGTPTALPIKKLLDFGRPEGFTRYVYRV